MVSVPPLLGPEQYFVFAMEVPMHFKSLDHSYGLPHTKHNQRGDHVVGVECGLCTTESWVVSILILKTLNFFKKSFLNAIAFTLHPILNGTVTPSHVMHECESKPCHKYIAPNGIKNTSHVFDINGLQMLCVLDPWVSVNLMTQGSITCMSG